jgi:predicted outer membrane protein
MLRLTCALALIGAAALAPTATAATPSAPATQADRTFLQLASQGDRFEIASSDVAARSAGRSKATGAQDLAHIARMIVRDHQASQRRLAALARTLHVGVPSSPDPVQQFLVSQLASYASALSRGAQNAGGGQSGADQSGADQNGASAGTTSPNTGTASAGTITFPTFRGFYLKLQAAVHQQAIQHYSTIAIGTANPRVRAYACQSIPVLRRHLEQVQQAIGSAQPELAASGSKTLATRVSNACAG